MNVHDGTHLVGQFSQDLLLEATNTEVPCASVQLIGVAGTTEVPPPPVVLSIAVALAVGEEGGELVGTKEVECGEELAWSVGHGCTRKAQDGLGLAGYLKSGSSALRLDVLEVVALVSHDDVEAVVKQ